MKPAPFDYIRARTIPEAADLLAASSGNARLLAGGQSLGPMLNLRLARPQRLIDIKRAAGLRDLTVDGETISIGAGITHAEIEDGAIDHPLLRHVAAGIAYRAVRNRGTIGGSLAHADPAADWIAVMPALDARIILHNAGGTRAISAGSFVRGAFSTQLAAAEILAAIELPRLSSDARWGYVKICRKTGEFAKAIGVAVLDSTRRFASVVAGAVEGPPIVLPGTAQQLLNTNALAASEMVPPELDSLLPHFTPAERALRAAAVRRALDQLAHA